MDLIQFEAGTKISDAKVTINGVDYPVTPARYTGNTPLSVYVLNLMQSNIAKAVVPTGGTTGQVLVKKSNTDNDVEWQTGGGGGASGDTFPIGAISEYAGATAPTNWLICDGSAISRTTYADLFNVIGTTYGVGDGSTTFNLPDLRGKVPVGLDSNDTDFDTLGETVGSKTHNHTLDNGYAKVAISINDRPYWKEKSVSSYSVDKEGSDGNVNSNNSSTTVNKAVPLGGTTDNNSNIQPSIVQNYIIKAFQSSGVVANVVQVETDSQDDVYSCDYINNKLSYSTTEKQIGTWIDDKPLYRKVINFGALSNNSSKAVVHDIQNLKRVVKLEGFAGSSTNRGGIPIPHATSNPVTCYASDTEVVVITTDDRTAYTETYIYIYYTKTTD